MRDWEPVLYFYADFSVLESSAPSVTGPHLRVPYPLCRFDTAGARIFFLSLSLDPFFPIFQPPTHLFFVLSRCYTKMVLFLFILR